jgi:hypothetical protein
MDRLESSLQREIETRFVFDVLGDPTQRFCPCSLAAQWLGFGSLTRREPPRQSLETHLDSVHQGH